MIIAQLDQLLTSARITGYTVEEDARYLGSRTPTLTYRMYAPVPALRRHATCLRSLRF